MIEVYIAIFLACGQPVFIVVQPVGKDMKIFSQESMGKERWDKFKVLIEDSKFDLTTARLELPVEGQTEISCQTKT